MPSLRSIANQYHEHANKIAARADRTGTLTGNQKKAIDSYRDAAAKIEALIRPEDSLPKEETVLEVKAQETASVGPGKKVSTRDKASTPQELLEKANG
jgi:hypothetical protein